jgi:hypothetical protein
MLIVYDRNTEKVVAHCSRVFDSGKWREATMEEILPNHDKTNLAAVYISDDARYLAYGPESWRLRKDQGGVVLGIERMPIIHVSTDATDSDNDGIPDIPADGVSTARITAETPDGSDTEITFRVTRGSISLRKVRTNKGKAMVELRSAGETVSSTITATAPGYRNGTIHIEFIPVPAEADRSPKAAAASAPSTSKTKR